MKLKEWNKEYQEFIKENPKALEMEVVFYVGHSTYRGVEQIPEFIWIDDIERYDLEQAEGESGTKCVIIN